MADSGGSEGGGGHDGNGETHDLARSLGQRLRLQRTRRQITRKELSRAADISERYLGEIERGNANVSLGLLVRIAETLGTPLSTFIPVDADGARIARPLAKLLARMTPDQNGARVLIAPTAQMFLFGTEIDYETGLLESGFKFRNPNVADACGCGESVSFKLDHSDTGTAPQA